MKTIIHITFAALLALISVATHAQKKLVPGRHSFQKKWVKNETYQMKWYAIKDTAKFEIGSVVTDVITDVKNISVVTQVQIKNAATSWTDSTVAEIKTFKPVMHSSYNAQRDMGLKFGKVVTGFYKDKLNKKYTVVTDTTHSNYFDSNIYPVLLRWLPLKDGYTKVISIYDYNPAKSGVRNAVITEVKSGQYASVRSGTRNVWLLKVKDEIAGNTEGYSIYTIDKSDRKLWKQEVIVGGRKMMMVREE
jgi:hypothetical protein